ncbi:unnamed protein product [Withania somnifera]
MNGVSGVMSRQVLPACGNLCFFCPAMRTRSRQPVKRYKKLISDIFPRSQEEEPNDRKIGKLCEYAAKNPFRIPKITKSLEEKCYKELRNENFQAAKVVMCIYKKLVVSCKEHMPLFANSLLSILHSLLDQSHENDMLIVGCESLFDFVKNQKDGTYMFHLDGFIPKLCQLAQQIGEEESAIHLRTVGLKVLSAMVWFMGEYSHVSADFDNIVSVVLENYPRPRKEDTQDSNQNRWVDEVRKVEGYISPSPEVIAKAPSWRIIVNEKGELNISKEDAENPAFWSRVCLHNMAKLGKEATTTRRVLESLFRYFDDDNLWPTESGIAVPILKDMQYTMDASGENAHLLLSTLVKHLDHKNVLKQPEMQLDIVQVVTSLAQTTKIHHSIALVSAITDIMRHLRRSIQCTHDDAKLGAELIKWNQLFQESVDECLVELSNKVGDAGPILDVMAVMLENITSIQVIARTTIAALYRASQIIASMPNLSYQNKAFPESLFHQLLPAMVHPDHETRVGAHRIFSVVLVPSSVSPQKVSEETHLRKATEFSRALSRTVSVFSSSAALFGKLRDQRSSSMEKVTLEMEQIDTNIGMLNRIKSTYSGVYSMKGSPAPVETSINKPRNEVGPISLRLSSHQIVLLLSSIWVQSISPANMPENYEAIGHTFSLVLLFSRAKVDPFLHLVEDSKLQASDSTSVHGRVAYGSNEDDSAAQKCLSQINITEEQSTESMISLILKTFTNLSDLEVSATRERLRKKFSPDDSDSLGTQFFSDAQQRAQQSNSVDLASIFDDDGPDSFQSGSKHNEQSAMEIPNLLSVNQLLESVLDTAHQVGRISVSTEPEFSYKEMAHHCETLLTGKQQKMYNLMNGQHRQDNALIEISENSSELDEESASDNQVDSQVKNQLANQKVANVSDQPTHRTVLWHLGAEYQSNLESFRLPASSPYDNFLKAARW